MGQRQQRNEKLFYVGFSLADRVPADHPLRRVQAAVDFDFIRAEVAPLYGRNGHVSLDPTLVLKMMFLIFYENVRSEREFMRQLPMRLDWLWFLELELDSAVPNHSVLSKARRRWGEALFETFFERVLDGCIEAGLVDGEVIHADSTLLKASADRDGRVSRVLWRQLERATQAADEAATDEAGHDDASGPGSTRDQAADCASDAPGGGSDDDGVTEAPTAPHNARLISPVDPDAAVHTRRGTGTVLGYRDHRVIDDRRGVIVATRVTPADGDDGAQLPTLLDRVHDRLGRAPSGVVGDSMYGTRANYVDCAQRGSRAYLKKRRGKHTPKTSWLNLLPAGCSRGEALRLMGRRRAVAEGSFAEAHSRMDHRRCRWRGRWRVQIQAHLIAAVQNIKKLIQPRPRPRMALSAAIPCTMAAFAAALRCKLCAAWHQEYSKHAQHLSIMAGV